MKTLITLLLVLFLGPAFATDVPGPSETAVRKAAALNALPVDSVTEVPLTLSPQ